MICSSTAPACLGIKTTSRFLDVVLQLWSDPGPRLGARHRRRQSEQRLALSPLAQRAAGVTDRAWQPAIAAARSCSFSGSARTVPFHMILLSLIHGSSFVGHNLIHAPCVTSQSYPRASGNA